MTFLKAAVFDWAGTVIDHGSQAPMGAFVAAFAQFGVTISIAQARGPMGLPKRDHIATRCRRSRPAGVPPRVASPVTPPSIGCSPCLSRSTLPPWLTTPR